MPTLASLATVAPAPSLPAPKGNPTAVDPNAPLWVANPTDQTVLRVDPASNSVAAVVTIEGRPDAVAVGEGAVWALDQHQGRVFRIDPKQNRVTESIPLPPGDPTAIAAGHGAVWVGITGRIDLSEQVPGAEEEVLPPGYVAQIDPRTNQVVENLPAQPVKRLQVAGDDLWVLSSGVIDSTVQVFDLKTWQGMAVPVHNGPEWLPVDALAVGPNSLWLYSSAYGKVFHASPGGEIRSAVRLEESQPLGYPDLLIHESGLWIMTTWGSVLHINPETNHMLGKIDLNAPLTRLISSPGAVWVLSQQTATLFRIDPAQNTVVAQIATGNLVDPTVVPTPTPRIVLWKPCPDAATSRLKVGDIAYVTKDPPLPNRVRREPNREADILGLINPGGGMKIIDGPACSDGWVWWKVKNADLEGWTPEGDLETYWLIPLYK